jgi:hypothetical protein
MSDETNIDPVPALSFAKKHRLKFFAAITLAVLLAFAGFWYVRGIWKESKIAQEELKKLKASPQVLGSQESSQLVGQLGKLIILPQNEQPTIATVSDTEKLKGQPFFINAKVGDKVFIYSQAQKAILFRPQENKIVEVAPFTSTLATPSEQ